MAIVGGGWRDDALCAERQRAGSERLRLRSRAGELHKLDVELGAHGRASQVDHAQAVDVDPPQPAPLVRGIDRAARGGVPLRPDGRGLEGGIERPRVAGSVVARLGGSGSVRRECRRVDASLPNDAAAEPAERAQT